MQNKIARIGLIQVTSNYEMSVEECLDELVNLTEGCLKEGADLVVLPECFQYKAAYHLPVAELTAKYAATHRERCSKLAKQYGAYVVPWDYEESGDKIYNTSYILDRNGNEVGRYRKVHPAYGETGVTPGCDFPVFDLDIGKVGIMICFDNYYAESARILALHGAELILYPLYGDTLTNQWEMKTRVRAMDNTVYVAPCCIGFDGVSYTGMIGPSGEIIAKLDKQNSYEVVEIEMGKIVYTDLSASKDGRYEDIKQLLLKARNVSSYAPLLNKVDTPPWEQIMLGR